MVDTPNTFSAWLAQAQITEARLTPEQVALLQAAFRFRQTQGSDYYSTRFLSHFLLHCDCGLKVAAIARLLGLSRPTASRQQGLTAKEAIRQAHHRLDGRPYGKLLPRYAGPIAQFLFHHAHATRADLIDFIDQTFSVRVSRVALGKFLKKFGLDSATVSTGSSNPAPTPVQLAAADVAASGELLLPPTGPSGPALVIPGQAAASSAPPFSLHGRNTPAPSS